MGYNSAVVHRAPGVFLKDLCNTLEAWDLVSPRRYQSIRSELTNLWPGSLALVAQRDIPDPENVEVA
ncbi:hypothetical protein NMY22_g3588 [Coprinellus aureogranulatus]|nr:hypothetical protein NMY22_g3588 [Coprinellus aureogranulatus]